MFFHFHFFILTLQTLTGFIGEMRNRSFITIFILLIFLKPVNLIAQNEIKLEKSVLVNYLDSLSMMEHNLFHNDSLKLQLDKDKTSELNVKEMVLFTPLTFYHSPARHLLSLDDNSRGDTTINGMLDRALMSAYLNHPEYVVGKEEQLSERNKIKNDEDDQIQQYHPDIVKEVAPKAEESDVIPMDIYISKPNFWNFSGDYSLQFMQNYVSGNWYKGGESNYSMIGNAIMQLNYNNKQKVKWENKLEAKWGAQTSKADTVHSMKVTTDMLRLTSNLGLQATNKWYYTLQVIASTQMTHAYKTNSDEITAAWFDPFTLNASLGMDYKMELLKKKLNGSVHIAPFALNWKYITHKDLASRYGIDEGKRSKLDYGSEFSADIKWDFTANVSWRTRLYAYTTYSRTEFEWENTFNFKISRYLSTNLFVYPRFDDNSTYDDHHGYWEFKEYLSLGLQYSF